MYFYSSILSRQMFSLVCFVVMIFCWADIFCVMLRPGHLHGNCLFTWRPLIIDSTNFVLSFPHGVLSLVEL